MRVSRFLCVGLLGTSICPRLASAQATGDQAQLTLGVAVGAVSGRHLWSASPQPVQFINPADTFALSRRIRSTLAIAFGGTYFSGEHLGFTAEGFLLGLGFEDGCRHVFSSGAGDVATVCRSIQGSKKSATAVALSVGPIVRFNSRKLISPYARANLGLVLSNQSSLRTIGEFPTDSGLSALVVYSDDKNSRVDPSLALGVGFTAAVAKGYHLRWELRDNIVGIQRVTGTIPVAGFVPPHERVFKHLFSMTLGFDVVLERRKGRRY
jgi:opacity protein-like surface antigen